MNNTLKLCKHLLTENATLVIGSALRDCHCIGLHSFTLNLHPKIRLFIADETCELRQPFDPEHPVIPIHAHKYDDLFFQMKGGLIHHLYVPGDNIEFNKYKYMRLSNRSQEIEKIGIADLSYVGGFCRSSLKAPELHTVSVTGSECAWMIIETEKDDNFQQVAYHHNLVSRPELYKTFADPVGYIKSYLDI